MKRRLTLAIGCLACTMPAMAQPTASASSTRRTQASVEMATAQTVDLPGAARLAQAELETRGLAEAHSIASIIHVKGEPAAHFDVRIDPPARLGEHTWLRGFTISGTGSVSSNTSFRTIAENLSTPPISVPFSSPALTTGERKS